MKGTTVTGVSTSGGLAFGERARVPGLLVAYAPEGSRSVDRCAMPAPFVIGRDATCDFVLNDDKVSKRHCRLAPDDRGICVEDLGSKNGTFLEGERVSGTVSADFPAVLRLGGAVLVACEDVAPLLVAPPPERFGIAGRFHVATLISEIEIAVATGRHLLLSGPSGAGKELVARAAFRIERPSDGRKAPFVVHNAALFASEEEAASTLFGVADRVFSGVAARPGLIEQANGGVLFLDEVHNLPERVQRTLLRIVEDGSFSRIGEVSPRRVDVRFVLATNREGDHRGLAHDLFARLHVLEVPSLAQRVADIPSIFVSVLDGALGRRGIPSDPIVRVLGGDHFEALCLDRFRSDNVRGLIALAEDIAARVSRKEPPASAIASSFAKRLGDGSVALRYREKSERIDSTSRESASHYERHRASIVAAIRECGGNLSAAERLLESRGIRCSRRWLGVFGKKWGIGR